MLASPVVKSNWLTTLLLTAAHFKSVALCAGALIVAVTATTGAIANDEPVPEGLADPSIASVLPAQLADPGDIRRRLANRGVMFGANYTADILGNVSGGIQKSTHYAGLLEVYTEVDFEKLTGWKGLTFYASGYQIHGTSISGENIGGLAAVSNIEAYPSTRLFEAWFEQTLADGKITLRLGQIATDAEFFVADGGGNFINSTFGWTTISSDNVPIGGSIYPIATPGVRLTVQASEQVKFMAGLWNGNPVGPCSDDLDPGQCNTDGLDFRLKDSPLFFVEGAYSYGQSGANLPGTLKIGGWQHFGDFDHLRVDERGGLQGITGLDPLKHNGNYGVYAVLDQTIYALPGEGRGISIFARVAFSPSDRNQIDAYFDGGIVVTGPFATRPSDVFGVALAYSRISDDASGFDRDSGLSVVRDHEAVLEVSYTAEVVPGLTIMPDFQYFWNPGGGIPDDPSATAIKDAAVVGLRTIVNY